MVICASVHCTSVISAKPPATTSVFDVWEDVFAISS